MQTAIVFSARQRWAFIFGLCLMLSIGGLPTAAAPKTLVSAPVLKWQRGGCFASWCQTGWYASPAVADLNTDGQPDVIWGSYDVVSLNGSTGALQWRAANGSRVWPGVAVADLTGNGSLEVIVGRGSDQLTVYNSNGTVLWTRNPFGGGEVRTLAVEDLETDGQLEIIVGRASGGETRQLSVYEPDGSVRPGWPARHTGDVGYGWGMYNENVAVADLNNDGYKEIIGPTDTHYITALDRNGNQLSTNAIYNAFNPAGAKVWSQVGVHVDQVADLRGYANCGAEHRPNFANSAPAIADVNGDNSLEIIVPGDVYNCDIGDNIDGDLYIMPWILNLDRTRWAGSGYDWTVLPAPGPDTGPLSEDYTVIENNVQNAVVADLDGDGYKEILFPAYDGKVHAYWLDKTEHGSWPYAVPGSGIRFAGEPIVADLDNDGHAEVIFTSWPQKGGTLVGQLHILDYLGNQLYAIDLPGSWPAGGWNGGLGAPTIANIDGDADLELVLGTAASGVVAYDLPNTASAQILWGTGRGSYKRTGYAPPTTLFADVPVAGKEWMQSWIEKFYNLGITSGCGANPRIYCPERSVTRAEMTVFLLRAMNYQALPHIPPVQSGTFDDVPVAGKEWMEAWIEEFFDLEITSGCGTGPLIFCPERNVTRAEMAVFVLRAKHYVPGTPYIPPPATHQFSDMPVAGKEWMEAWVDRFYQEGITGGCGVSPLQFCPEREVTRAEMAVFILRAFGLTP